MLIQMEKKQNTPKHVAKGEIKIPFDCTYEINLIYVGQVLLAITTLFLVGSY